MHQTLRRILDAADLRGLRCLVIGGNALILLGYVRNTLDLDLLVEAERRSGWLDLMRELGYQIFHGVGAFAQFEMHSVENEPPVDLMFVNAETWQKMWPVARCLEGPSRAIFTPRPEHLVALKLHAAASPSRSKPESDWEDIRQIVRICALNPADPEFRATILRYGGESALERIESFYP